MKEKKKIKAKITLIQRVDKALLKTAVLLSKLSVFFSGGGKLHNARFAYTHEMEKLLQARPETGASLLLGAGAINHSIAVRPVKTRKELGNLLVVAPTRGGKGLLAVSQLLAWPHSVVVNDIKGDLFIQTAATVRLWGRFWSLTRPV